MIKKEEFDGYEGGIMSVRNLCREKNILYLLYAVLFVLPLHPFAFYAMLVPAVLGWAVLCRIGGKKYFRLPPFWQLGTVFLGCAFLSGFVSPDIGFSLANWAFQPFLYGVLYVMIYSLVSTEKEKERALYAFLFGAVAVALYGFYQYANISEMAADLTAQSWVDPERFPLLKRRMYSTLENPNLFGGYLLMIISVLVPFILSARRWKDKVMYAVPGLAFFICLVLTYSRGAWLSLGAIVLGLALFYDKRFGFLFLLAPAVLLVYHGQVTERFLSLFSGEDTSVSLRFALWESTMAMIEERPLLGVGWGSYFLAYPDYNFFIQEENVLIFHAHNLYLNMPAEVGIPGGICYLAFFLGQGILSYRNYREGRGITRTLGLSGILMVMAMAVIGLSDHILFSRCISFIFWSLSALCVSRIRE